MVLPAGVTTALVYKKAPVSFGGEQASVELEITPSVRLIHTATGTPLADFIESTESVDGARAEVTLPHTDQPGFHDEAGNAYTNWHYKVRTRFLKAGHQPKTQPLFTFQAPTGQAEIDLSNIPHGVTVPATSAPVMPVTSINGNTGAVELEYADYTQLARTPETLIAGDITRDANGAPLSAAVIWPDGTAGVFTGTPSTEFPGSLDAYTITYGDTRTYTQPTVTRNADGTITNQPAIVLS